MNIGSSVQNESPHHFKEALCKAVQQEVEESFGHRVTTSRDCIRLSEEVYYKTSFKINPNTLRRFFGLVKAQYPPSLATLTILANYCGYHSLEEISATRKWLSKEQDVPDNKSIYVIW